MLQNCSLWQVAGVFFVKPTTPHSVADISRSIHLAPTSVNLHIQNLKKMDLIIEQKKKQGTRTFIMYVANQTTLFRQQKQIYNILVLRESGLIQYVQDELSPKCIVLFGSYFRGEDVEDSDIDLFIQSPHNIDVSKYEKVLRRKIQLHHKARLSEYPKELRNNIINGIVLTGYNEVFS